MKKALDKKVKYIVATLLLFIVLNIVLTYAYIRGETVGSESMSTISFKAGNVSVRYENNSGDIIFNDIIPGFETVKSFSLTSNFGENRQYYEGGMWYQIALVVDKNEFDDNSFYCSVSPDASSDKDGILAQVENIGIPAGVNQIGVAIAAGKFDNNNKTHVYNMTISFPDTGEKQDHLENCEFQAHIILKEPKLVNVTFDLNGGYFTTIKLDKNSIYKISENSKFVLPTPIKEGYSFTDWEVIDGDSNLNENILDVKTSNITVKAKYREHSFANESWEQIVNNIKNGKVEGYKVGDTREIMLDGFTNTETGSNGLYTIRIANNSHYYSQDENLNECKDDNGNILESQTACGFVIEFVDAIYKGIMNSSNRNAGGWPVTAARSYLNGTVIFKLPSDLQKIVQETIVISGHGSNSGETNFKTTDKMYLISSGELFANGSSWDTAASSTRQLDYYSGLTNVTCSSSNPQNPLKKLNGTLEWQWLRNAGGGIYVYHTIPSDCSMIYGKDAADSYSIAPAFRIG